VLVLVVTALAGAAGQEGECVRWRAAFAAMPLRTMEIETPRGRSALSVRVAATPEQQAAGFQCATPAEVKENRILFDFGREILSQFHMQNVPVPLDIAFGKADGRIFALLRMEPSSTALYGPLGAFRYAVEAPVGFLAARGVAPGAARLIVPPSSSSRTPGRSHPAEGSNSSHASSHASR
jgi:uncharacterized membrane protein (UPF0127 family)